MLVFFNGSSLAAMYRYVDEQGREWYVNHPEAVPAQYRGQIQIKSSDMAVGKRGAFFFQGGSATADDGQLLSDLKNLMTQWCPTCRIVRRVASQRIYDKTILLIFDVITFFVTIFIAFTIFNSILRFFIKRMVEKSSRL